MTWFDLTPESIAERNLAASPRPSIPTLGKSIALGAVGFTVVSVAGFIPWAVFGRTLHRQIGEAGMYAVCALVFLVLSSFVLHRLIIGPGSLSRFAKLFTIAFSAYSVLWIVGWMTLRGHLGSAVGLLLGCAAMGAIFACAFRAGRQTISVIAALFVLNAAGYFIGGLAEGALIRRHAISAMLTWGVCYGLGLGAGLGIAFYLCQIRARQLIAARA